jgi:HPt (histidine-containing phosphotransfer) domain-containing protein
MRLPAAVPSIVYRAVTMGETVPGRNEALHKNVSFSVACDLDAALNALEGDRELLLRMIQIFLGESGALRDRTRQAVAARDGAGVERAAHTLRGALANFRAREAGATARRLEESAAQGDWQTAAAAHADLEKQMEEVVRALAAFGPGEMR